jgi:hypothetical protein
VPKYLAIIREQFAWLFFYGPLLSFLPARWRGGRINHKFVLWGTATIISGGGELLVGLNLFGFWYAYPLSTALLYVGMYFVCDGAWRVINAKEHGQNAGTLVLVFVDQLLATGHGVTWKIAHPVISDLTTLDDAREDWQLKIEAVRSKQDWEAGKIVRFGERYFRLESCLQIGGARPFVYFLRSMPIGVPSHSVLNYFPVEAPQKSS